MLSSGFKFSQLEMSTYISRNCLHGLSIPWSFAHPTVSTLAEVVLCLLLSKFTFAKSDKEVVWNLAGVRFPSVKGGNKASLPMKVGLYHPAPL